MSREHFARFRELVHADEALMRLLWEAQSRDRFLALAIRLGEERGLIFRVEDVQAAMAEGQSSWLESWGA